MSIICKTNPNLNPMPIDLNSTHGYLTFYRKFRRSFGCRGDLSPSWGSYCWWMGLGWLPEWPSHHPWSSGHPSPSWGSYWLGWLLGWSVAVVGVLLLVDRRLRWLLGWPFEPSMVIRPHPSWGSYCWSNSHWPCSSYCSSSRTRDLRTRNQPRSSRTAVGTELS